MEDYSNYDDDGMGGMGTVGASMQAAVAEQNYRAHPNEATYMTYRGALLLASPTAQNRQQWGQAIAGYRAAVANGATYTPAMTAAAAEMYHRMQNPTAASMTVAQAAASHMAQTRANAGYGNAVNSIANVAAGGPQARAAAARVPATMGAQMAAVQRAAAQRAQQMSAARAKILQEISKLQLQLAQRQAQLANLR
jgi:hypothetical protein